MTNLKQLYDQFAIPKWVTGDTPGKMVESVEKRFKDKLADHATKNNILENIATMQEFLKMQQGLSTQSKQVPDQMNGQIPEGMNQFVEGGFAAGDPYMMAAQMIPEFINSVGQGINNKNAAKTMDTSGLTEYTGDEGKLTTQDWMGLASPFGSYGLIGKLLGKNKVKDAAQIGMTNNALIENAGKVNTFNRGGNVNTYVGGGIPSFMGTPLMAFLNAKTSGNTSAPTDPKPTAEQLQQSEIQNLATNEGVGPGFPPLFAKAQSDINTDIPNAYYSTPDGKTYNSPKTPGKLNKPLEWFGKNLGNMAQYSTIFGNMTDKINRAPSFRRDTLIGKEKENLIDTASVTNPMLNLQKTAMNMSRAASGGDKALMQKMLPAIATSGMGEVGKAGLQVNMANIQEKALNKQIDFRKGIFNAGQTEKDLVDRRMDEANYQSLKADRRSSIFEDASSIGKEAVDKRLVKEMFGYSWDGKYYRDTKGQVVTGDNGEPLTQKEMAESFALFRKQAEEKKTKANTNDNKFGGYLKK